MTTGDQNPFVERGAAIALNELYGQAQRAADSNNAGAFFALGDSVRAATEELHDIQRGKIPQAGFLPPNVGSWKAHLDDKKKIADIEVTDKRGDTYQISYDTSGKPSYSMLDQKTGAYLPVNHVPPGAQALLTSARHQAINTPSLDGDFTKSGALFDPNAPQVPTQASGVGRHSGIRLAYAADAPMPGRQPEASTKGIAMNSDKPFLNSPPPQRASAPGF